MAARSCRQRLDIGTIDGHDLVPVAGEQCDDRVDDVGHSRRAEQSPRSSTERLIGAMTSMSPSAWDRRT
jgi:hypothetical protein